jgi:hypothetical protein
LRGQLVKEERLFNTLQLTPTDFDLKGDLDCIKTNTASEQVRGFFPYYQPTGWMRYGLNIERYHTTTAGTKDESWLKMDGSPNEWAVMYHDVRLPTNSINGSSTVAKAIVNNSLWTEGKGHVYASSTPILTLAHKSAFDHYGNKNNNEADKIVGVGTYGSPLINTVCTPGYCLDFNVDGDQYILVFQCRVRADKIKICGS